MAMMQKMMNQHGEGAEGGNPMQKRTVPQPGARRFSDSKHLLVEIKTEDFTVFHLFGEGSSEITIAAAKVQDRHSCCHAKILNDPQGIGPQRLPPVWVRHDCRWE